MGEIPTRALQAERGFQLRGSCPPMTPDTADVTVVGLGVIGLSTASALARRGLRVVGIDRFGSGHPERMMAEERC